MTVGNISILEYIKNIFSWSKLAIIIIAIAMILLFINYKKIIQSTFFLMIKKNIKVLISVVIISVVIIVIYYFNVFRSGPLLKAVASTGGSWIFSGTDYYYNVYQNGFKIKTNKFDFAKSEEYIFTWSESSWEGGKTYLKDIESNYVKDITLQDYAKKIVEIGFKNSKFDSTDLGSLYILDGKYYITVLDNSPSFCLGSYDEVIFEYLPQKNKIVEIARFKDMGVLHIELAK
ncbi:MAG TPA: hypothetical protein DEP72_07160 [Clostridiales bacterium]|nr:MAG: hypothetical protein A2Y18_08595 [Clostridiales bacterium GWD2_32_19]HCC07914.1 hypothetical protein [Clostridiales bacterium]